MNTSIQNDFKVLKQLYSQTPSGDLWQILRTVSENLESHVNALERERDALLQEVRDSYKQDYAFAHGAMIFYRAMLFGESLRQHRCKRALFEFVARSLIRSIVRANKP